MIFIGISNLTENIQTQYKFNLIIEEILYPLWSYISLRLLRSSVNYKTLHYYYTKFVKCNNIISL